MSLFDFNWDSRWTKTGKPPDRDKPFHRVNSDLFDEQRERPDGRGYDCGCRSPFFDYDTSVVEIFAALLLNIIGAAPIAIMKELMRAAPSWVPVERKNVPASQFRNFREREMEVEGVLWHSFQTWTDVPLAQWHTWYDWNFHLVPAKGYKYMRGLGNDAAPDDEGPDPPLRSVSNDLPLMECEWDCGAFGSVPTGPQMLGPMFISDWVWPLAGQYIWVAGRWIYDCGHASSDEKSGDNPGLMRTELHPCKAIATTRWEAFNFDENGGAFVPAIQFMFFACRNGGYKNFPAIDDVDYEFVVDLPKAEAAPAAWPIGHTPDFPLNTVVLRPRLLKHFNYAPFQNAFGNKAQPGEADPEIELLRPPAPGRAPEQVKIKIPLTKLKGKNKDSYGVIVSLGWHDPAGAQAARVKKVTVTLDRVQSLEFDHDEFLRGKGEWTVKVGVNGRWASVRDENVTENHRIPIGRLFQFHLAEEDSVNISAHGMEEDDVGEFLNLNRDARKLRIFLFANRREARWDDDVDQPDNDRSSVVAREIVAKLASTWSNQNDPLGIIEPGQPMFISDTPNPFKVKDLIPTLDANKERACTLTACFTEEVGSSAELVFDPTKKDYTLHYTIRVEDQQQG